MHLIISGILQLTIVLLLMKSINMLNERIVKLETNEKALQDKIKILQDRLDINVKDVS